MRELLNGYTVSIDFEPSVEARGLAIAIGQWPGEESAKKQTPKRKRQKENAKKNREDECLIRGSKQKLKTEIKNRNSKKIPT